MSDNLFPCCSTCNLYKGDLSIEAFRKKIENLYSKPLIAFLQKYQKISIGPVVFFFEKGGEN